MGCEIDAWRTDSTLSPVQYGPHMPETDIHPSAARVVEAASALGLVVRPQRFPEGTRTAADAASAIGVGVGQIVKSLVFSVDDEVVLACVSGANQLDEAKLAQAAGGTRCERVGAEVVRAATGFPIGGVPPFGHTTGLRVFIDADLLAFDEVWAAAGTPHDVFGVGPADLVRVSGGEVAELSR